MRRHFPDANSLLELGCGTGFVLEALREAAFPGWRLVGSELYEEGLAVARRRLPDVELVQADARALPYRERVRRRRRVRRARARRRRTRRCSRRCTRRRGRAAGSSCSCRSTRASGARWTTSRTTCAATRGASSSARCGRPASSVERATSFVSALLPAMALSRVARRISPRPYDPVAELRPGRAERRLRADPRRRAAADRARRLAAGRRVAARRGAARSSLYAMCGILGVVGAVPPGALDAVELLRHRGPDGEGRYTRPGVGLAMRRLAIIDLATGDQPVANEAGDVVAVVNGELYNYRELRAELVAKGHVFRGEGDVELVPHLYEEHGDAFVERLRGMFALALWDERRGRLLLARDRFGIKPLYLAELDGGALAFASELRPLLALGAARRRGRGRARRLPRARLGVGRGDRPRRRAPPASGPAARARGRARARDALLDAGAAVGRLGRGRPARGRLAPPALRRPARRAPLGRARLLADRRACRCRARGAAADVLRRLRRARARRAGAGARGGRRARDASRGAARRHERRGRPAGDRRRARAAARRRRGDPALVPLPCGRVRGQGRARGRRRRRGLRRLLALPVGSSRRAARSPALARAAARPTAARLGPQGRRPPRRRSSSATPASRRRSATSRGSPTPAARRGSSGSSPRRPGV